MTKKVALIQKLSLNTGKEEAEKIAQDLLEICGEKETKELLENLIESEEESEIISGILLAVHLKDEDFNSEIYSVPLSSNIPVIRALFHAISQLTSSPSTKLLLKILREDERVTVLKEGLDLALEKKPHVFAKGLEGILRRDLLTFADEVHKKLDSLSDKERLAVLRALLRRKDTATLNFTLDYMEKDPPEDLASNIAKLLNDDRDPSTLVKIVKILPQLPDNSPTLEATRTLMEISREGDEKIWQAVMEEFSRFEDSKRSRAVVDYLRAWFEKFPLSRQVDIVEFIGSRQKTYDVPLLCGWACSDRREVREKAREVLEDFDPHEALYEMFQFLETEAEKEWKNMVPLMIRIGKKKNINEIEDIVSQLPLYFQRELIRKIYKFSESNIILSALFKSIAREYSKLNEFGTLLVSVDRLPHCYERDDEIDNLLRRFKREGNKSLVLMGPSGTGKSAIYNELAYRLITHPDENYPYEMILQITTGDILAGTKYLGEWETRVNKLIQTLKYYKKVILYVSNINDLIWAGRSSSSRTNFASVLAPYIERGEIVVVGESTPEAYSIGIGSEYHVKKLFQNIQLKDMDENKTEVVLRKVAVDLQEQIKRTKNVEVEAPATVINRILELSTYYFPGIARPGNAAHLLEQVMEARSDDLIQDETPKEIKSLVLTPDDVMRTLADTMEVPELIINDNIKLDIDEVRRFFSKRVLGQEGPVNTIVSLIALIKAGLTNPERPHGVYFFIGPTGVGKTELARVLAEYLTGNPDRLIRIDMSAFKDYSSFERLIGSHHQLTPQGTYMTPNLVEKIRNHPFSVILLDEFEKAHPNIFDLFLQVFDYGKLLDARSEVIDFRQSIILMTSNIGYEEALEDKVGFEEQAHLALDLDEAKREMARTFRPEFINRIDKVVVFNPLDRETMLKITHREIGKILSRSGILRRNLDVKVDSSVVQLLLNQGFSPRLGARQLKRVVEEKLMQPLAETIVRMGPDHGSNIFISASGGEVKVMVKESRAKSRNTRILERVRKKNKASTRLVTSDSLGEWIEELSEKVSNLEAYCEAKDYHRWKRELFQKTMEVTFWDNPSQARKILEEIHYLERILFAVSKLRKEVTDLENLLEMVRSQPSKKLLAQAALRFLEVKKEYDIVEFEAHCETRRERADAFVVLSQSTPSQLPGRSGIESLHDIYSKWCEKNAFSFQVLSEKLSSKGELKSLSCYIKGVCVYGLIQGERGIHRFEEEEDGEVFVDEVHLEVWSKSASRLGEDEVEVEIQDEREEESYLMDEIRSSVRVRHNYSNVVVEASNNRSKSDNVAILKEFIASKIHSPPQGESRLVRTYRLEPPHAQIYDHKLDHSYSNVKEFLSGDLDEVLIGRIRAFREEEKDKPPSGQ